MNGKRTDSVTSIASSLGIGSGIDTASLIDQLDKAAREPKEAAIKAREDANSTKISSLGQAASGIDAFANALSTLISGGTLFTQPVSSDSNVFTASALPGARIGSLSAQVEVRQLAQAQSLVSENLADLNAAVGMGTLRLTTVAGDTDIVIGSNNNNLVGLARAINVANVGVTASIVEDSAGARLTLKSATGEAKAFTLAAQPSAEAGLSRFAYGPGVTGGMALAQSAQDAIVKLDGVEIKRSTNSISDLISGVKIELKNAKPGSVISLGASRPTEALKQAVGDFVSAYNELRTILNDATKAGIGASDAGPLRGEAGVRELQRQLARLTSTRLSNSGTISTLAEVGVRTERDGSLTLDSSRLDAVLAADPDGVEALFNPSQQSDNPLVKVTSQMGRTKPGTYALTDLVASANGDPATGKIAGMAAVSAETRLVASIASPAAGLVIEVLGNLSSATVTVDLGLGGALKAIRDQLLANGGPIKSAQARFAKETAAIGDDKALATARADAYRERLVRSFTAMDTRVTALKATQSYLDQQIKIWTNDNNN
jgi:flagellar hook-associated protein 2